MAVVANCFCAIVARHTLAMIISSEMYAIKWCIYLVCTLDITHMIKCIRLSSSLAGRACKWGYFASVWVEILNMYKRWSVLLPFNVFKESVD